MHLLNTSKWRNFMTYTLVFTKVKRSREGRLPYKMDGGALRKFWQEPLKRYQDPALRAWLEMLFSHLRGTNFYITYYLTLYIFFRLNTPKGTTKGAYHLWEYIDWNDRWVMVRVFPKSANQPNEMALTICNLISPNCCWLMRDWKVERLANGKEISAVFCLMVSTQNLPHWTFWGWTP